MYTDNTDTLKRSYIYHQECNNVSLLKKANKLTVSKLKYLLSPGMIVKTVAALYESSLSPLAVVVSASRVNILTNTVRDNCSRL